MSLFILDTPGQEALARRDFALEGIVLNFVIISKYLGAYMVPQAELAAWLKPQVEAWTHGVRFSGKIAK